MPWTVEQWDEFNAYRCSEEARDENRDEQRFFRQDFIERNICGFTRDRSGDPVPIHNRLANLVGGITSAVGSVSGLVGAITNFGRPAGPTSVAATPMGPPPQAGAFGRPSGGFDLIGPPGFSTPQDAFSFQPASFSGAQIDRPFFDVGEIDPVSGVTDAVQREFLLSQAGLHIGQRGRNGRGRMSYKQFRALVRDMGAEPARRFLNLDERSFAFLLINAPKRRGKSLTAKQARDARNFTCRVQRFVKAAGLSNTGTRRRAPCRPKKCA